MRFTLLMIRFSTAPSRLSTFICPASENRRVMVRFSACRAYSVSMSTSFTVGA